MTTTTQPAGSPPAPHLDSPAGAGWHQRQRYGRMAWLLRGRPDDPAWARPALLALLAGTAALYLWDLSASGWP